MRDARSEILDSNLKSNFERWKWELKNAVGFPALGRHGRSYSPVIYCRVKERERRFGSAVGTNDESWDFGKFLFLNLKNKELLREIVFEVVLSIGLVL